MTIIHEPDCSGLEDYDAEVCKDMCWGHMRCEPQRPGDFRVCGECLHVFRTPGELQRLDVEVRAAMAEPGTLMVEARPVGQIYSCPVCAHDF